MRLLLVPFRLVRELVGHNACFFGLHRWVWGEVHCYDNWGFYRGVELYQKCPRCRKERFR